MIKGRDPPGLLYNLQVVEDGGNGPGVRPVGMVRVDGGIPDNPLLVDNEACRHRQLPRGIAVKTFQVDTESLVDFLQVFWQLPDQVELPGNGVVVVMQQVEAQMVFLNRGAQESRLLW